jgi:diadenosine tetraphosphate (Ap4A) HIT family hydrolase
MVGPVKCAFCELPPQRIVEENEHAVLVFDAFPVSPGHSLVIPKRHVSSFFDVSDIERLTLLKLLNRARDRAVIEQQPDGFNIGINDGAAAGQTVSHLHIHLIPRYHGDRPDPRGGVRWVIPDKADYWSGGQA